MNCQEVMELMQRSLDGDLDAAETSLMTEHIRSCPDCAAMLERLTRLSNGLAQLPRVVPSFSIVDSILPQLEQIEIAQGDSSAPAADRAEAQPSDAPFGPRSSRRRRRTLQRVSGVVAAGVVAGLLLFAHPLSWLHSSGVDYDAASQSEALSGGGDSAASSNSAQEPKTELFAAPMQKSAEGDESAQAPQASDPPSVKFDESVPAEPSAEDKVRAGGASSSEGSAPAGDAPASAAQPDSAAADGKSADTYSVQKDLVAPSKADNPPDAGASDSAAGGAAASGSPAASDREGTASSSMVEGFVPSSIWQSPDGKLQASVNGGKLDIVRTDDNSVAFETAVPEGGAIDIMKWEEDSSALHYVRTDADGTKKALLWTAETGQETEDTGQ
ncbi:anti-sigma factor family protein [Cohnella zeiphila]|uniref:Anti-sigma-W factor RsiW n=1 Tax=Cohnella zeiphila TaxID=2761120 RepID=A0A7X0VTE0_9BACL|nr:zf-HC2 domain-containing protein [Cohnella zeiphila]MBB6729759.1 zf-HC2 domain-containing protein [Cohnella zeiphila]